MKKYLNIPFYCFVLLLSISSNAQTLSFPTPMAPNYQLLLQSSNELFVQAPLIHQIFSSNEFNNPIPAIHQFLSYSSNKIASQINTISPTHYADTHNAFFCRLERKINKNFVTNVRIRLEGF